jgi:riboflavin transporter FmnP
MLLNSAVIVLDARCAGDFLKIDFKNLALLSALICFGLTFVWLLVPKFLLSLWAVGFSEPVGLVCRRVAALFAGIGVMLFRLRRAAPSPARDAVATGLVVACSMLALLGMIELGLGHAGPGILLAIAVEIALALGFRFAD